MFQQSSSAALPSVERQISPSSSSLFDSQGQSASLSARKAALNKLMGPAPPSPFSFLGPPLPIQLLYVRPTQMYSTYVVRS